MAAGARPVEAGGLIVEIAARVEPHLALPRDPQQPPRPKDAYMIVRQAGRRQPLQRFRLDAGEGRYQAQRAAQRAQLLVQPLVLFSPHERTSLAASVPISR